MLDSIGRGDLADPLWPTDAQVSVTAGDSVGRAVARRVLAACDDASATWTGIVPTGASRWSRSAASAAAPLGPLWGGVRIRAPGSPSAPYRAPARGGPDGDV